MGKDTSYVGLEITSRAIRMIAGYVINDLVYIRHIIENECSGLENGLIKDPEIVIKKIKDTVTTLSKELDFQINDVALVLPPFNLWCMSDTDTTNTIDGNDVIQHIDTVNVLTKMKKRPLADSDLKIVDIIPDLYMLNNGERYVNEPVGKISQVLTLHASIYAMSEKVINQFISVVNRAGLKVKHSVIAPYSSCLYLSTIASMPSSYILLDIGHSLTTISQVNERTSIVNSRIIRFGGDSITQAISDRFNLSKSDAEKLKVLYGIDKNPNFPVYLKGHITFEDLADVIIKSIVPSLDMIKSIIKDFALVDNEKLPIVICGGTSKLNNIAKVIKDELNQEVIEYNLETIGARNPSLVSLLGLIKYWGNQPQLDEEEIINTSLTRVDSNKKTNNRSYQFDEEL